MHIKNAGRGVKGAETMHIILYKTRLCKRNLRLLAISLKTAKEKRKKSN